MEAFSDLECGDVTPLSFVFGFFLDVRSARKTKMEKQKKAALHRRTPNRSLADQA
jgi:hypothetical protein